MGDRGKDLQDYHNRGEQDASDGKGYNPPHGIVETNLATGERLKELHEDNEKYREGFDNGKKQSD